MKIFIGGLLPSRQDRFKRLFPDVEFLFASDQEPRRRWVTQAAKADVVIIDQARCDHTIIDQLKRKRISYELADGNAAIATIIERSCTQVATG